ncbi:hypothetical protein M2459_000080 [Parabacteroides sp. PF5-5]|uniref:hypothetical protein n=1 Tax=unclassified Parabacteroides TaxID=2649774 RepID=UPI00247505EF|nr:MULTISPECIES: hypothetical protein [unclassified Parabacteroides]MDH6303748.1 hypothetical protein [Parabacteroides sp. PH5-39]MDH6314365.1 hypothetical protein [Parabacteroides sp. PF5-13]MDH6318570.1 hypothetical protein [Parabacteroides sp. PH5-13]MDH6322137.1 hypothetical protein [Parabacteroides sp. PH5-8]MDH6325783.1 hypothetical protein [Parabacteroides sp. PH5-41]
MRNILFITGILALYLLFTSYQPEETIGANRTLTEQGAVMQEKNALTDMHHRLEILSNDLKSRNFLTPRRNVQTIHFNVNIKIFKNTLRTLQLFRLKEKEQLFKVSEFVSECQTINYTALLCRKGYLIYALRKIII